jgi:zinc protease
MNMLGWPQVHLTEVDGVPAVWADVPGPLRAALLVRVGTADETLVTSGITRMLQHLALAELGHGDHPNGHVDQTTMHFSCTGDAERVGDFIETVTRRLADPPTSGLDEERASVRYALARRRSSIEDALLTWRYGAAGYGLNGQSNYVLERYLDPDVLVAWGRRYATRANAVLWLSGPPPVRLQVHLPDGEAMPVPDANSTIQPQLPAWFTAPDSAGVALHAILPRDHASPVLAAVLQARLLDQLRVPRAVASSPQADYRAVSRDVGRLLAVSDIVDGRQQDAVRIFTAALADLAAAQPPRPEELVDWRSTWDREAAESRAPLGFVASQAWNLLVGHPGESVEQAAAAMARVTAADVAAVAGTALGSALAAVPEGVFLASEPWHQASPARYEPLAGIEVRGLDPTRVEVIVVSPLGLTWRSGGDHITVPHDRAVAVLSWPDGRRVVVGDDASRIVVEPTMWLGGRSVVQHVDAVFGSGLRVEQAEREAGQIPQPPSTAGPVSRSSSLRQLWWSLRPRLKELLAFSRSSGRPRPPGPAG